MWRTCALPSTCAQVPRAAAETITEVSVEMPLKPAFDFDKYVAEKAHIVNQALDLAVPLVKPETIHESMRCVAKMSQPER